MKRIAFLLFVSAFCAACGGGAVSYSLDINLPDQAARDQVASIRVVVVIPDDTSACADLLSGDAAPGDDHNPIEDEITFDYPVSGGVGPLKGVGPGQRLFYGEARDGASELILRGCSLVEAGRGGEQAVTINLQWIETCQQTNGGVEACDGVDNDCDESTDEDPLASMCPDPDHAATTTCNLTCVYECESPWQNADGNWANGCECQPTRGGEEWCDGLDNDCDGVTDPGNCLQCADDAECQDPAACISGTCNAGVCSVIPLEDGQGCDDGEPCTEGDACQGGVCQGTAKDCADGLDCTADSCDANGDCQNPLAPGFCYIAGCVPEGQDNPDNPCVFCDPSVTTLDWSRKDAGTPCDDGQWCTGEDTCSANGVCEHTGSPCQDICQTVCSEDPQECQFNGAGDSCDDGLSCTSNDICDGFGACGSIPDNNQCPGASECQPACAVDETGCVYPPGQVIVDCPDSASLDGPAECVITLPPGQTSEACVSCEAERLPMVLDRTNFWDAQAGCVPGDFTLEADNCRLPASGAACLLFPAGSSGPCCTNLYCNNQDGLRFGQLGCANNGWRLSKEIDLSNQGRADLCYTARRQNDYGESVFLQGVASEVGGANTDDFFCSDAQIYPANQPTRVCQPLPTAYGPTLLTLWAEAFNTSNTPAYLNDLAVVAYPTGCLQNAPIVRTLFSGCGLTGDYEYDGWQSQSGDFTCMQGYNPCGLTGGLLVGDHPVIPYGDNSMDMVRQMDLTGLRGPGKLCFNLYVEPNTDGEFWVDLQGQSGYEQLMYLQLNTSSESDPCRQYCLDLSQLQSDFFGSPWAQIQFHAYIFGSNQFLVLNDIIFLATIPCPPAGEIAVQPVYDSGDGFRVPVTDEVGSPRRVLLNCRWGDSTSVGSDEFDFVAP